jgi:hypothetical protein
LWILNCGGKKFVIFLDPVKKYQLEHEDL